MCNTSHSSSTNCSEVISKRTQKDSGEERVTTKSNPMMNLVSQCSEKTLDVLPSSESDSPEKTRHESQLPLSPWTEQRRRTGRPVEDASHQVSQSGMLTTIGLLKSGNLMN